MGSDDHAPNHHERPVEPERFRAMVDVAPDLLLVLRLPSGQICDVNQTACQRLGIERASLLESMAHKWIKAVSGQLESVLEHMAKDPEGAATLMGDFVACDGRRFPAELLIKAVSFEGEPAAVVAARDMTDRFVLKQALLESEAKYRALVETSSDWIWEMDSLGVYTYASPKVEDFLGFRPDEVVGRTPFDLMRPDEATRLKEEYDALLTSPRAFSAWENINLHKDGHEVVLETSGVPILDAHGMFQGYRGVDRDISERSRVRDALRDSEARLKSIFRAAPTGIGVVSDRVLVRVNERICQMTGYSAEELIGQKSRLLYVSDEDFEHVGREKYRQIRATGTGTVETRWRRKDGFVMDVLLSSTPIDPDDFSIGVTFTALDITDRKRAEEDLVEEKAFSESVIDSLPGVFYLLDQDSRLRRWNDNFERLSGYSAEELMNMKPWDFFADNDKQYIADQARVVFETGLASATADFVSKAGHSTPYFFTGVRVVLNDAPFLAGVGMDITDRKQAEAEREELIAELEARNTELERFTYTVSHDLKSPLITIKGYVGMLAEDLREGNTENVDDDIQRIANSADKMADLLKELLELSRIGRIVNPSTEFSIDELARDAVAAVEGPISERGVQVHIGEDLPVAYGDRQRLLEVLQNLIENSVKYMGDQQCPSVRIGAEPAEGMIRVHVQDNGIGIESQYHERIFGLFDQLEAGSDGTGIGLALVKRIVEVHGGRVWVESEGAGMGSRFCFTIPAPPSPVS